jgi:hypothetical protein
MKTTFCFILLMLMATVVLSTGTAPSVSVSTSSLATTEDSVAVAYSVVDLVVPRLPENSELSDAYLEFYMDASSTLPDTLAGGFSTLEITPMPTLVEGKLGAVASDLIVKRSVRLGDDITVRVYITNFLRQAFSELGGEDTEVSLSLLVGPISGSRYGRFTANTIPNAGGAKAKLTVLSRERYNPDGAR